MKLIDMLTIGTKYSNTNSRQLQLARKSGNAKGVALDFKKFCEKHGQVCFAVEGTFKLDKKQENGSKEVTHYWNVLGDGVVDDPQTGPPDGKGYKKYKVIIDFAGKHDFEDKGLAEDLDRSRYTPKKEINS